MHVWMKTTSKFDSSLFLQWIRLKEFFFAHVIVLKSRVYCFGGWGCKFGVRVCEGKEGDMNPGKLVLVVVWGCLFIVYCCTKVVYATSVGIPAKDTLEMLEIC